MAGNDDDSIGPKGRVSKRTLADIKTEHDSADVFGRMHSVAQFQQAIDHMNTSVGLASSNIGDIIAQSTGLNNPSISNISEILARSTGLNSLSTSSIGEMIARSTGASSLATSNIGEIIARSTGLSSLATSNIGEIIARSTGASSLATSNIGEIIARSTGLSSLATHNLSDVIARSALDSSLIAGHLKEVLGRNNAVDAYLQSSSVLETVEGYARLEASLEEIDDGLNNLPTEDKSSELNDAQSHLLSAVLETTRTLKELVLNSRGFLRALLNEYIVEIFVALTLIALRLDAPDTVIVEIEKEAETICKEVSAKFYRVKSATAPVRSEPSRTGKVEFYAEENEIYCLLDRQSRWVLVQKINPDDPKDRIDMGWMSDRYLTPLK